jgi:hypothetical protein
VEGFGPFQPVYAYAVINDQANSDGSFVPPVSTFNPTAGRGILVPAVVEANGFTTELILTNWGSEKKRLRLSYFPDPNQPSQNAVNANLELAAGEQRIIPEFVQFLRNQAAGIGPAGSSLAGALLVTSETGDVKTIVAGARTSVAGSGDVTEFSTRVCPRVAPASFTIRGFSVFSRIQKHAATWR